MKKTGLILVLVFTFLITNSSIAQSCIDSNKYFKSGETVYMWGNKDWNSQTKSWNKYTYKGKVGKNHQLVTMKGTMKSTMNLESLETVFSESNYKKFGNRNPVCNSANEQHKIKFKKESLQLINNYRATYGKSRLKNNSILEKAAQDYVNWMVKNLNSHGLISHTADGTTVSQRVIKAAKSLNEVVVSDRLNGEYAFKGVGENITSGRLCAFEAFESWRKSPGHNNNMKSARYKNVGFGIACGINNSGERIVFAVQVFGGEKAGNSKNITNVKTITNNNKSFKKGETAYIYDSFKKRYLKWTCDGSYGSSGKSFKFSRVNENGKPSEMSVLSLNGILSEKEYLKMKTRNSSKITKSKTENFQNNAYYRITSQWQGDGKSLDILNSGKKNQPILAESGNYTGQMWRIKKVGRGLYTLSTKWQGPNLILDVIRGENELVPVLNKETGNSGGAWKIIPLGNGYYRITNLWKKEYSLDIVNDGENNKIQLGKTGNYSGQIWKITKF